MIHKKTAVQNKMVESLEAAILVGGAGTRLKSVVNDRPKPMAIIGGKPFLEWILVGLRDRGITRIVLCSGYMPDVIEGCFGDGHALDLELSYSVDPYPLGTGGAVRHSLHYIIGSRLLVLNGDSYCDFSIETLIQTHHELHAAATIWTAPVMDRHRYGSMDVAESSNVLAFHEKQTSSGAGVVNAGVYLLERDVVSAISEHRSVSLETEVFPGLVGNGLYAAIGDAPLLDIGTPESFALAEEFLSRAHEPPTGAK